MNYRKKANITLAAVFGFFLVIALFEHFYPEILAIRLLYFVSQAALVGGIADWFAVTAIFKKPLGWSFHTALIPRNREKVIEAVASMVQKELLRVDVIRKKIEGISFVDALFNYVEKQGGSVYLADRLTGYLRNYAQKQKSDELAKKLAEFLRHKAQGWELTPRIQAAGEWAIERGYLDQGLDRLAEGLWDKVAEGETRQTILRYLEAIKEEKVSNGGSMLRTLLGFVEMSDGLNLDDAADAVQVELLLTLRNFQDQQHPLRISLKESLLYSIVRLGLEPNFETQVEQFKNDLLDDALLERTLESVLQTVLTVAASPSKPLEPNALHEILYPYVEKYWLNVQENTALREIINTWIVESLCRVIQNEHDMIGNLVRETLTAYTDEDLNQFIEEKAGNDLQWIRINGSMIGGVVGLMLFLVQEFVYTPFINPIIMPVIAQFLR
jgi:Predicted membrane protein